MGDLIRFSGIYGGAQGGTQGEPGPDLGWGLRPLRGLRVFWGVYLKVRPRAKGKILRGGLRIPSFLSGGFRGLGGLGGLGE